MRGTVGKKAANLRKLGRESVLLGVPSSRTCLGGIWRLRVALVPLMNSFSLYRTMARFGHIATQKLIAEDVCFVRRYSSQKVQRGPLLRLAHVQSVRFSEKCPFPSVQSPWGPVTTNNGLNGRNPIWKINKRPNTPVLVLIIAALQTSSFELFKSRVLFRDFKPLSRSSDVTS